MGFAPWNVYRDQEVFGRVIAVVFSILLLRVSLGNTLVVARFSGRILAQDLQKLRMGTGCFPHSIDLGCMLHLSLVGMRAGDFGVPQRPSVGGCVTRADQDDALDQRVEGCCTSVLPRLAGGCTARHSPRPLSVTDSVGPDLQGQFCVIGIPMRYELGPQDPFLKEDSRLFTRNFGKKYSPPQERTRSICVPITPCYPRRHEDPFDIFCSNKTFCSVAQIPDNFRLSPKMSLGDCGRPS